MAIDENLKEKIKDLRFNQHKTIRKIAKTTGKSSRDIILVLKELGGEGKKQRCKKGVTEQGVRSREEPLHVKAFDLYSQGKSPVEALKSAEAFRNRDNQILYGVFKTHTVTWTFFDLREIRKRTCGQLFCEAKQYCSGRRANCRRSDSLTKDCRTQSAIILPLFLA